MDAALPHQRMNPSSANLARSLGPKPRRTEPRRVEANAATVGIKETKNVEFVFDIPFVIKLREEEEERPLRSQRYTADKLPRPATTTCGPFTFTLSFSERTSPMSFAIDLKIIRTTAEADDVFDCSVPFNNSHCCFGSRSYKFEETNFLVQPKIGRKVGSTLSLRHVVAYQNLSELFGVKEPVEMEVRVHTLGSTSFPIPRRQTKCDTRILDSLPHYVDSPSPNNVAFVLSRSGNKRLFASKSLLASSSSYFKEAFNPSRRSSRTPFSSDSGPSFVDDSDAEEATEERPESEEDDLPHPDQIGTRSSSKRLTEGRQSGEDAGGTPSKRRKTGGAKREEEEADQEGEAQQDMTVIHVDDVEYSTLRALLVFLIGAKIQFAPLSSQGRAAFMKDYREKHPLAVVPVSSRSIYRLATRFRLPALQDLAISHLKTSLNERTAALEALGDDCYHFPAFRDVIHNFLVKKWSSVSRSDTWKDVLRRAKQKEFSHTDSLLPDLLEKVANAT